jgi:hypothetical protein
MGLSRRGLLRAGGLAGAAGAVALGTGARTGSPGTPRPAKPDAHSQRFTVVVMPDTQYLFDADRIDAAPLDASLRWVLDHAERENIVFLSHLGDLTQSGGAGEMAAIGASFEALDRAGIPYSVLAGNHDVDPKTDDQRGDTPYLRTFGPQRFPRAGASPDGYNTFQVFAAGGREWLVLALDWRPSAGGIAWAQTVLDQHPHLPCILTTHEFVTAEAAADTGAAELSEFGRQLWDGLVARNDQIFLTLNGHFWPPGRATLTNDAGHDVHVHITNYQDRYFGGSAMIRLYRFDLARDTIDVSTISPYFLGMARPNALGARETELTGPVDRFSVPIDFAGRFAAFAAKPVRFMAAAHDRVVLGTVAYWRFGSDAASSRTTQDVSGRGNDLTAVSLGGALTPAADGLRFDHAYLRTAQGAPINGMRFERGYTIEAFVKLPEDWSDADGFCGILSRMGTGGDAGKTADDTGEPTAVLNLSGGAEPQWAAWPLNQNRISTNWGHYLRLGTWWHLAVVNDGSRSVLYVDGCPVVRNPSTRAVGIATTGEPWLIGASHYGRITGKTFRGWLGDVRIVDRPLPVEGFLIA